MTEFKVTGLISQGDRYGRLTILDPAPVPGRGARWWRVKCNCGSPPKEVRQACLRSGDTRSCGGGVPSLRSAMPRWTSHRTASTTLANSARKPSPVFFTMRPLCSLILGSTSSARCAFSRSWSPPRPPPSAASTPRHRPRGSRRDGGQGDSLPAEGALDQVYRETRTDPTVEMAWRPKRRSAHASGAPITYLRCLPS